MFDMFDTKKVIYCLTGLLFLQGVGYSSAIEIGNPEEIFLRDIPEKYKTTYLKDRKDPTSFAEFSEYFKHDFEIAKENFKSLPEDLKKDMHKGFQDPDFVPPLRPEYR